jgi:hypothetical protein
MIGIGTGASLLGAGQDATVRGEAEQRMATEYFTIVAGDGDAADGNQALNVPLNRKKLGPTSPERVRRLRKHLVASLRAMRTMKDPKGSASPLRPEPDDFTGCVARAACTACRGWCCKGGGEHAYLDERVMARVRHAQPELDARAVLRLFIERVPAAGYDGSCVFHGAEGCTLDRALRSDVCNSYFCTALGNYVKSESTPTNVMVIAADGEEMRTARVTRADPRRNSPQRPPST